MAMAINAARKQVGIQRRNYGKNHGYKIDGRKVPGVTTIISATVPKPALIGWAARKVAEYVADKSPEFLDELRRDGRDAVVEHLKKAHVRESGAAAVRGTEVHRLAERVSQGEVLEETPELEPLWGHAESCVKFLNDWRISPVLVEGVVGHRTLRYAGTVDLIADLPDGRRVLFDYKTSGSGIWPDTALQLAAYQHAQIYMIGKEERPMEELNLSAAYAVHLRADGYDVYPLRTDMAWDTFQYLAHAYHLAFAPEPGDTGLYPKRLMDSWVLPLESWKAAA